MKKNVLVFGLISGFIVSAWAVGSIARCYTTGNFGGSMLLGYASMILAFSLVFVGIKNYRDKFNNGVISFGKAFKIGLLITLVASTVYVVTWLIDYYVFIPDFMDKYSAHIIRDAQNSGATAAEISSKTKEMATMKELYNTPVWVVLFTYMEIFPVGLLVTIIAALILKKKDNSGSIVAAA
ncbi:DUF4199 domain-containing protein [Mucilaginibacter sp.]|jgi:hypothetical protein|uniref:DUF4199 domain-containing protein n=1 Tax=Mucilaginibacter sp. TaxID=1882438 RepID=UPI0035621774